MSYFVKHISPRSLEKMGIALVHQQEDQETLLLYSICVNSIAAKFLNTIISEESDTEMAQEVRVAIAKYNASAELAMSRIPLLASPSLTLLQALLCSVRKPSCRITHKLSDSILSRHSSVKAKATQQPAGRSHPPPARHAWTWASTRAEVISGIPKPKTMSYITALCGATCSTRAFP